MNGDLTGRVVVVTGGSRGLGRAIAGAFATAGARVAITGRQPETLRETTLALQEAGGDVAGFTADAASEDEMSDLARKVEARFGPADVLVNNAGINPWYERSETTSLARWQQIIDVNLTGVFLGCRIFGAAMLARGRGSIINVTSIAGHVGLRRTAAYCAAKGGVEVLTKALAMEWAERGVRVNAVAPAYFETDLTAGMRDNDKLSETVMQRTPMRRFGRPGELAGACLFLASDAASYVTGQSIGVDGGYLAA